MEVSSRLEDVVKDIFSQHGRRRNLRIEPSSLRHLRRVSMLMSLQLGAKQMLCV
jgi:hypothetical protein